MIKSRKDLNEYLRADKINYDTRNGSFINRIYYRLTSTPISDQYYIWEYIKALRHLEYYLNNSENFLYKLMRTFYTIKVNRLSYITGFQIPPNTCGKGLTIWHWGPIIINANARLGDYCVLHPLIVIGHKSRGLGAPKIGERVTISSNVSIIGDITIGNSVIIAPNAAVTCDLPDNCVVAGVPAKIIKYL